MMLALLLSMSQGQVQRLYNEGVLLGPIVKLDCVGPAVVCDLNGTYFGRITISVTPATITATGTPDATTYLRGDGTWAAPASGSGNAVEVTVAMPSDGSGWAQTVVTGQAWVTATSKIVCQPFNDGGDSNNTDEVYSLAEFSATTSTRVASTGFTLTAASPNGVTGTFKFHCLGV